ncbi:MAG: carboxymuconolactone decarboxylase family protein [Myxococcales bacterium]|nr:carboxymuconolactone decarboxylase family protein [Myxococcales bacterium]
MSTAPKPPKTFRAFIATHPRLGEAWDLIHQAGGEGPIDVRTARLIKIGIAMGAMREGAVHSGVRKALAMGITADEIQQIVALCAGTLGMPATVANFAWVNDVLKEQVDEEA